MGFWCPLPIGQFWRQRFHKKRKESFILAVPKHLAPETSFVEDSFTMDVVAGKRQEVEFRW